MMRRTACGTTTKRIVSVYERPSERARRRLAPVDALDAGAVHLGDVRAVDEREGEHGQPEHAVRSSTTGRPVRGSPNTIM